MEVVSSLKDPHASMALRKRLEEAGVVFEFVAYEVSPGVAVDEALHRQAVNALFEQVLADRREHHRLFIQDPRYADVPFGAYLAWDLDRARISPLNLEDIQDLSRTNLQDGPAALFRAFCNPPYGTRFAAGDDEASALFSQWLAHLGLEPGEPLQVLDWVKGYELDWQDSTESPADSELWSDYFDEGLEWWGVWCLSIWNPARRSLSVVLASTTD